MNHIKYIPLIISCLFVSLTTADKNWFKYNALEIHNLKYVSQFHHVIPEEQRKGLVSNKLSQLNTAEFIAKSYLQNDRRRFGLTNVDKNVRVQQVVKSPGGEHVIFQGHVAGIPVHQSQIVVTLDNWRNVTYVASTYRPDITLPNMQPSLAADVALSIAKKYLNATGKFLAKPDLQLRIFESKDRGIRLTYRICILTTEPRGDWEIFIDASNGDVIHVKNRMLFSHTTDGSGMVWDPDPLTTAQNYYGGLYQDYHDADSEVLNAQRITVILKDITYDQGYYKLEGPYVRLDDIEAPVDSFPSLSDSTGFIFTRSEQKFEHVMVYYNIDQAYRWISTIGFDIPGLLAFRADPHGILDTSGVGGDISYYSPSGNFCVFGEGGVDDAEDAAVIWHEYEHAIQENIPPSMDYFGETAAIQEGSSDYWAASHARDVSQFGWQQVFLWDAGNTSGDDTIGTFWPGRRCDLDWRYPDDYIPAFENRHRNGQIWSSALIHIWSDLGREVTDRLFLQAHYIWGSSPGFETAAHAFMEADRLLYNGSHMSNIIQWFIHYGFIDSSDVVPTMDHIPLTDCEDVNGPYRVQTQIIAGSAALDTSQLWLIWGRAESMSDSLLLQATGEAGIFEAIITGNGLPGFINYYLALVDSNGYLVTHPEGAPVNFHRFYVGPDTIAPSIAHVPLDDISYLRLPVEIKAQVFDNLGISSVRVEYYVNDYNNWDYFKLTASESDHWYAGVFNLDTSQVDVGDSIFYRIIATDSSLNQNLATHPQQGYHIFKLIAGGGKIVHDFELDNGGFIADGDWEWGIPDTGPAHAHSGERVWATKLNQDYSIGPKRSALITPAFDLRGFSNVTLKFWQWYDIEYRYDGATVNLSLDSGQTWRVIEPIYGYDAQINNTSANPLADKWAFTGISNGWILAYFNLDEYIGESVQIRFDFGSDLSQVKSGWYIDNVVICDEKALLKPPVNLTVLNNRGAVDLVWELMEKNKQGLRTNLKKTLASGKTHLIKNDGSKIETITKPQTNSPEGLYYKIYRGCDSAIFNLLDSTMTKTYTDSSVLSGYMYYYYVTLVIKNMESSSSDTVSALVEPVVGIEKSSTFPTHFSLEQNYPNPFNSETTIKYQLPKPSHVLLEVFNILGEKVGTLVNESQKSGFYSVAWRVDDQLASGIYLYRIVADDFVRVRKLVVIK